MSHLTATVILVQASPWCRPIFVPGLKICILLLSCCTLESTTQWRLSTIKVKLELGPLHLSLVGVEATQRLEPVIRCQNLLTH